MKRSELTELLAKIGVRPNRRLGQNFLVDANLLETIVRAAQPAAGEVILEIGAGTGILTARLLEAGCRLTAVEIDHRLAAYLRQRFGANDRVRLVEADACKLDYDAIMGADAYRCIANLPYACSSVFLARLTELEQPPHELFVLLQKEMAARLTAAPGSKQYGAVSVRLQLLYTLRQLRTVRPEVFHPVPEIASALVHLHLCTSLPDRDLRRAVGKVAGIGFAQRRKKLLSLLGASFGGLAAERAFAAADLQADVRAEQVSVERFLRLAACLQANEPAYFT